VISLLLHAAGFYVFQIVYPPALSLLPPPARVNLITPAAEEGRTILRWIEAEDPALTSKTVRPAEMKTVGLPAVEHIPSYIATEPALKSAPALTVDLRMPSSQPPGAVTMPRLLAPQKLQSLATTISFSAELQKLGAAIVAQPKFIAATNEAPEAITFRIAVGPRGEVLYCFAENSSGDRELDAQARRFLAFCRFPATAGANEPIWGTAMIEWGNDVVAPAPRPSTTPLP
jgi:hypothetical protein